MELKGEQSLPMYSEIDDPFVVLHNVEGEGYHSLFVPTIIIRPPATVTYTRSRRVIDVSLTTSICKTHKKNCNVTYSYSDNSFVGKGTICVFDGDLIRMVYDALDLIFLDPDSLLLTHQMRMSVHEAIVVEKMTDSYIFYDFDNVIVETDCINAEIEEALRRYYGPSRYFVEQYSGLSSVTMDSQPWRFVSEDEYKAYLRPESVKPSVYNDIVSRGFRITNRPQNQSFDTFLEWGRYYSRSMGALNVVNKTNTSVRNVKARGKVEKKQVFNKKKKK